MRTRFSLALLAAVSLPLAPASSQQPAAAQHKRAFTPEDWYRLTTVSSPALSPDGRRVA